MSSSCKLSDTTGVCSVDPSNRCPKDHKSCVVYSDNNNSKRNNTFSRVCIFILLGIIILLLSTFTLDQYPKIQSILNSLSVSIIAGSILTWVIDLPAKLKEYETSFTNALISLSYIKKVEKSKLWQLRSQIIKVLYNSNGETKNQIHNSLLQLDQQICEYLQKTYCTKYRHTIGCSEIKLGKDNVSVIEKKNILEYSLINALDHDVEEGIIINKSIKIIEGIAVTDYIHNLQITYKVDGQEDVVLSLGSGLDIRVVPSNDINPDYYDSDISVFHNNREGVFVKFNKVLDIKIEYTFYTPVDDICYVKRVQYPTCDFMITISHTNKDIKLYGQLFGTGIDKNEIKTRYIDGSNILQIETAKWLLPKDGVMIVST